jgi:hypothetical protein
MSWALATGPSNTLMDPQPPQYPYGSQWQFKILSSKSATALWIFSKYHITNDL